MLSSLPLLFVSILCALVLALPPQMHEIYRTMAEAIAIDQPGAFTEPVAAATWLVALASGLFTAVLNLGRLLDPESSPQRLRWAAAVICVLPLFGASVGTEMAKVSSTEVLSLREKLAEGRARSYRLSDPKPKTAEHYKPIGERFATNILTFNDILDDFARALAATGVLITLIFVAIANRQRVQQFPRVSSLIGGSALLGGTLLLVILLAIPAMSVFLPQTIMPVGILCLFFLFLTAWVFYLRLWTRMTGRPILAGVICLALVLSWGDLNDNHRVRIDAKAIAPEIGVSDGEARFKSWLTSRPDFEAYPKLRYPIYVVAAQGGGIYAALHAASFLAAVQDECSNFADHIFAISGVSGGSVGASLFAALVRQHGLSEPQRSVTVCSRDTQNTGLFLAATKEIFSRDLLSPVLAGLLFPDLLQRFLFWEVPAFDRARALEYAFEQAWEKVVAEERFKVFHGSHDKPGNPLAEPYLSLWQSPTVGPVPALLFNTTEVHSGRRRVIAPFYVEGIDLKFLPVWKNSPVSTIKPKALLSQMPLSTAALLSARFPWVSPAGWFEDLREIPGVQGDGLKKIRVVDGGYFENSGIVTAMDVVNTMERALVSDPQLARFRDRVSINVITLSSRDFSSEVFYGWGEFLEPIRTMLSTRSARAPIETKRAQQLLKSDRTSVPKKLLHFDLSGAGYPLPLGWRISPVTDELITFQLGSWHECTAAEFLALNSELRPTVHCLRRLLVEQLGGG